MTGRQSASSIHARCYLSTYLSCKQTRSESSAKISPESEGSITKRQSDKESVTLLKINRMAAQGFSGLGQCRRAEATLFNSNRSCGAEQFDHSLPQLCFFPIGRRSKQSWYTTVYLEHRGEEATVFGQSLKPRRCHEHGLSLRMLHTSRKGIVDEIRRHWGGDMVGLPA